MKTNLSIITYTLTSILCFCPVNNSSAQITGGTLLNSGGGTTTVKGQSSIYEGTFFEKGKLMPGGQFTVWGNLGSCSISGDLSEVSSSTRYSFGAGIEGIIDKKNLFYMDLSYMEKGCGEWKPGSIQVDIGYNYCFVNNSDWLCGIGGGLYYGLMIDNDDFDEYLVGKTPFLMGLSFNIKCQYKHAFIKCGYETDFLNCFDHDISGLQKQLFLRLGLAF